jgi:hypothetical protein
VAALTLKHIQQRDNRWCIVDLVGKHGRRDGRENKCFYLVVFASASATQPCNQRIGYKSL